MADYLPYLQGPGTSSAMQGTENFDEQDTASRLNNQLKANELTQQVGANDAEGSYLQALYGNQGQVAQAKSSASQGYAAQPVQPSPKDTSTLATQPASLTATTSSPTYQPPTTGLAAQQPATPIPPAAVEAAQQDVANAPLPVNIKPGTGFDSPAAQATISNAAGAQPGVPVSTAPAPPSATQPTRSAPIGPNGQPLVQATPFDNNQFMQNLTQKLANTPGANQELMKIKEQRDQQLNSIFQMAANGSPDEAQFLAQQNGFQIPDSIIQNGNITQGLNLAQKAYPDEPDKGNSFFKAYTGTQGTMDEKVQAALAAGGTPTGLAQREVNKAMALTKAMALPIYTANGGMSIVRPGDNTSTPVINSDTGDAVTGVVGSGKNMRITAPSLTNAGVAQPMTPYQLATIKGRATVNVDNMINNASKYGNTAPPTPVQRQAMIDQELQTLTGAQAPPPATGLNGQMPNVPAGSPPAAAPVAPPPAADPASPVPPPASAISPTPQPTAAQAPVPPAAPAPQQNAPGAPLTGAQGPIYAANDQSLQAVMSRGGAAPAAPPAGNGTIPTVNTPLGPMPNPDGQQPTQSRPSSYVVISPNGQPMSVPANRLQAALDSGGRLAQ